MKILVTGGGGFLGRAIVGQLLQRGDAVHTLQRGSVPELESLGATAVRGDLADAVAVRAAGEGCDAIIHVAAKAGVWGRGKDFFQANVVGTRNVIDAARHWSIDRLVYTSSPSVVFSGQDEDGIDESAPYPSRYLTAYPKTKAIAERLVRTANDERLSTVALRPHLIWGPGDPHLVPRIIERAKAGRLRLVGQRDHRRNNLVDSTYIDNAAAAHLAALDRLAVDAPCAGKAYFITNGEPIPMANLINRILAAANLPPVSRRISPAIAYAAGATLELAYRLMGIRREPMMTRFVARQLATAHWFDISAARRDLGYEVKVDLEEGFARLGRSFKGTDA